MNSYDVVIIGGGPGGYVAAIRAGQLGLKSAVIERESVGGVCLNWGCIPTKALLRNAEILWLFRRAKEFGIRADKVQADLGAAIDRSRRVVEQLTKGVQALLRKNKVDLIQGDGFLLPSKGRERRLCRSHFGRGRVAAPYHDSGRLKPSTTSFCVGVRPFDKLRSSSFEGSQGKPSEQQIEAQNIIIATGARARTLPGLEVDGQTVITSYEAVQLRELPKKLIIIGAGAVGVEFAYFYNAYGSDVTIVEMLPHLLPKEDEEISAHLERAFRLQGIKFLTGMKFESAEKVNGKVKVTISPAQSKGQRVNESMVLEGDKVLVAVGVQGNIEGIGLEEMGVVTDGGFIQINEKMQTNVPGIYAVGDVTGKLPLAHCASAQGEIAVETIAGCETNRRQPPLIYENIPRATYCQPQVASVGLTERQAKERGFEIKVGKFPFVASGKALAMGEREGLVKVIVDAKSGTILGAHLIGADVTELLPELALTQALDATALDIGRTIHAHPTLSEALMEAARAAMGQAIHT